MSFQVGHRVVVVDNDYDRTESSDFGVMAGHYGKVTRLFYDDREWGPLLWVDIMGHTTGSVAPGISRHSDKQWAFYARELEHAD